MMEKIIKNEVNAMYSSIKAHMEKKRKGPKHWGKKELAMILTGLNNGGDYSEVHQTKLYQDHGGEYCELLSGIALWVEGKMK